MILSQIFYEHYFVCTNHLIKNFKKAMDQKGRTLNIPGEVTDDREQEVREEQREQRGPLHSGA